MSGKCSTNPMQQLIYTLGFAMRLETLESLDKFSDSKSRDWGIETLETSEISDIHYIESWLSPRNCLRIWQMQSLSLALVKTKFLGSIKMFLIYWNNLLPTYVESKNEDSRISVFYYIQPVGLDFAGLILMSLESLETFQSREIANPSAYSARRCALMHQWPLPKCIDLEKGNHFKRWAAIAKKPKIVDGSWIWFRIAQYIKLSFDYL